MYVVIVVWIVPVRCAVCLIVGNRISNDLNSFLDFGAIWRAVGGLLFRNLIERHLRAASILWFDIPAGPNVGMAVDSKCLNTSRLAKPVTEFVLTVGDKDILVYTAHVF